MPPHLLFVLGILSVFRDVKQLVEGRKVSDVLNSLQREGRRRDTLEQSDEGWWVAQSMQSAEGVAHVGSLQVGELQEAVVEIQVASVAFLIGELHHVCRGKSHSHCLLVRGLMENYETKLSTVCW